MVDLEWRKSWYSSHKNDRCRPTDTEFTSVKRVYESCNSTPVERRLAATISLPTPVPAEETYNMLIPCKSAVATFPLTVLLDSIATTPQPTTWTTAKSACRDFARVKNVGISFNCTDREMVTKLGGLKLTLCGRPFAIRVYSEFSHLYWIGVTLAQYVHSDDIYNYFDKAGDAPLLIKSTYDKNGIQSRHITVNFSTRAVPLSLLFDMHDPVREIYVSEDSGLSYIQHKNVNFNNGPPPSISANQANTQAVPPTTTAPANAPTAVQDHESAASNASMGEGSQRENASAADSDEDVEDKAEDSDDDDIDDDDDDDTDAHNNASNQSTDNNSGDAVNDRTDESNSSDQAENSESSASSICSSSDEDDSDFLDDTSSRDSVLSDTNAVQVP
ncbi:Aste57867_9967 [Aphanomyces stellatus]|uniref:Aste57867_9967 protein n=1 Tax=Aphanomyces stellatus TaxID=120398 RepID=A0A485KP90_9STRA|nr:hypothetical protein As57867_009928 [Aphanomyces stellatus]VFT86845.1 Aste57867_9967 [Aphanomyces stellatus]